MILAKESKLGPLVSQAQWDRVQGFIDVGIDEGAKLVTGGTGKPAGLETGYFVKSTVFSEARPDMRIAQEAIFGPVLAILPFDTEDEAVDIANDSDYGLAGGVWAGDQEHGIAVARRIRTGQIEVNGGRSTPTPPSVATSSPGSAGSTGRSGSKSSWRSRRSSCRPRWRLWAPARIRSSHALARLAGLARPGHPGRRICWGVESAGGIGAPRERPICPRSRPLLPIWATKNTK